MKEKIKRIIAKKKYEYFGLVERKDVLKRELRISHTCHESPAKNLADWQNNIYLQLKLNQKVCTI